MATARVHSQQRTDSSPRSSSFETFPLIGSFAEDQLRLDQLRGRASTAGWLMRSTVTMAAPLDTGAARTHDLRVCRGAWTPIAPTADLTWNSRLPVPRNDGAMWSGRGTSLSVTGGVRAACGRLRVQLAPTVWYARNALFSVLSSGAPELSGFANPFHSRGGNLADLPLRFGQQALFAVDPGESAVEVDAGPVAAGIGSESQWWGPGMRNGLMLSNHAAGIPSVRVRTRAPVRTPLGRVEARWIVGALTESPFFDTTRADDMRSLSGLIVVLTPAFDSTLSFGAARIVYAPIPGAGALPARAFDAIARWGEGLSVRAATFGRAAEQMTSLFARWTVPSAGAEVYGEWARVILPRSLRSLLVAPQFSQGYTVGAQWISTADVRRTAWRAQAEFTMLEQPVQADRGPAPSFYVSPVVGQGYTQRGQVIGAAIGPGSSSQWIAADRMAPRYHLGAFLGRVRWENDEFFRQPTGLAKYAHDVSVLGGVRGALRWPAADVTWELLSEKRLNYLFQNGFGGFSEDHSFDIHNVALRLSVAPR